MSKSLYEFPIQAIDQIANNKRGIELVLERL